eukprot:1294331-Pleurochrysis_carterae.AAC.3
MPTEVCLRQPEREGNTTRRVPAVKRPLPYRCLPYPLQQFCSFWPGWSYDKSTRDDTVHALHEVFVRRLKSMLGSSGHTGGGG